MTILVKYFSAQKVAADGAMGNNAVVRCFSARQVEVERALGDNVVARGFSAKTVDVEGMGGEVIASAFSSTKAGYDINGEEMPPIGDYNVNIIRTK